MTGRKGYGGGGRGKLYTYRYTVTTRMTPALRWAAMRAIFLMFYNCERQSHKTVSTNHNLSEEKTEPEAESSRGSFAHQPNAIPLGQIGSLRVDNDLKLKFIASLCLQCCAAFAEWRPVIRTGWLNISIIVWQRCLT